MKAVRKFEFSLQSALDLRRREEQAAQQRLAAAQRLADAIRAQLRQAQARYWEAVVLVREGIAPGEDAAPAALVELGQIEHSEAYLAQLKQLIDQTQQRLAEATAVCARRRQELLATAQRRKSLQRLRERREQEHRRTELRREDRLLDEVAVTTFSGNQHRRPGGQPAADRAA